LKTKFLGQAYQSRSPILASQTAINIFAEGTEGNSDEIGGFYGTPGLLTKFTGAGSVRGLHAAADGKLYAVIGAYAWRIGKNFAGTNLGLIGGFGPVSIQDNGQQVSFAHQTGMSWVSFTGNTVASVANAPANGITSVMDDYLCFTDGTVGLAAWGISALEDLSSIDPLDVATAEGAPDNLVSILCDHREVWLFGTSTTEIWSDTGAAFFPFERSPGGFIEQGCMAAQSPRQMDNSVFWLGQDKNGQGIVYRANSYIPVRISTHAMEFAINQYPRIDDAFGITYQEEGHSFYWLIFPSGNSSWCYDVATGGWHQRLWLSPNDGSLNRPRANCYAFFNGMHLVGDFENGKIYQMSLDVGTDDGADIYRERAFDLPDSEMKRVRMDFLELKALTGDEQILLPQGAFQFGDFQPGAYQAAGPTLAPPLIWLQISRDAGRRFGYQRIKTLSATGQTTARVRWRRAGTGRDLVLRVATTMKNRVHWVGMNFRGEGLDQ
jgi:Phage stabilisation protein